MKPISLSASKLNLFKECPRCFWDAYVCDIPRPRGIFPSLPGGMDLVFKTYFDSFRGQLPPMLIGKVPGVLMADMGRLNRWRNWRTGLIYEDPELQVKIIGALDDCLTDGDIYIPFDNKTRGSAPKSDGSEYYQGQLDIYELFLISNGYKTKGSGFLAYYWPNEILKVHDEVTCHFGVQVFELKTDPERAKKTIKEAVDLMRGKRPKPSPTCEMCVYQSAREELTKNYGS